MSASASCLPSFEKLFSSGFQRRTSSFSVEQGYQQARDTGLELLAVMRHELGSLDKVKRVVKVLGMVNAGPEFEDHPRVINGCSDLFVQVLGEKGKHARSAVGMGSLPMQIPVEIEVIVEVSGSAGKARTKKKKK